MSRVPALLALVCGVFALQSLPTAAAAKGGAAGTVVSAPVEATPQSVRRAERAAAKAEVVPPPPPAAAAVEAPPPPAGAHARHEERRQQRQEARAQSTAAATSGAVATTKGGESNVAAEAEALAQRQKKGFGGSGKKERKEKAKEKTKEKTKGKTKGKETEAGGGSPGEEAEDPTEAGSESASLKGKAASVGDSAPVAQASVAATALAGATTPAVGTGSASITSAAPASTAASGGGPGRRRRHRARAAATTGAAAQPLAASTSQPLAAPSGDAQASAPHKAAKRSHHSSSQPALVKTFTKIVGVVPTPIRILIVALIGLALLLGARSLFSGVRTRRLVRQRGQLLEDVGVLQAALLPVPPSRLGPVETSVAYRPADGPGAGGDFYDVFALEDGQLAVIVGDVSGHGREALPHTALVRFTVRAYLEAGLSPRKALQTAGSVLERQLGGSFATVLAATYHPRERRLTFASAGHPPPVVLAEAGAGTGVDRAGEAPGRSDVAPVTACSAPPVGAGMRTGTRQTTISIPGPTRLCFHTDGVTEARIDGELFGAERLAATLSTLAPEADASALLDRVSEQSDARPDDMAACLLRVLDGEGAPAIALEQLELDREAVRSPRVERFLGECGVSRKATEAILREARARLQREQTVLLELSPGAEGPTVALAESNVIHAAAFAIAGAS